MKKKKIISFVVVYILLMSLLIGCGKTKNNEKEEMNYPIKLETEYGGKEVDLAEKAIRNYVRLKDNQSRLALMLYDQLNKDKNERIYADRQNISFSWTETYVDETFTLHFYENEQLTQELFTYQTNNNYVDELGVFIPGKTYYYKVVGSKTGESKVDSFSTKNDPARYITAGAILNMRDIGGYLTKDGKRVKYGMLYRGGALDGMEHPEGANYILERGTSRLDEMGLKVFNEYLKIKGEIDLRGVSEDQHETPTFGGDKKNMCQCSGVAVSEVFQKLNDSSVNQAVRTYFSFMANENNYPIYFHCNGGADRTGALAFLINGLFGVEYNSLAVDYELTSFSFAAGGIRQRSQIDYNEAEDEYSFREANNGHYATEYCKKMLLDTYTDCNGNLQIAIEEYLLDCGVTKGEISNIKKIMLV